jgi:hypothetical protein
MTLLTIMGALAPFGLILMMIALRRAWERANTQRMQLSVLTTILAEHWKDIPTYNRENIVRRMERVGLERT